MSTDWITHQIRRAFQLPRILVAIFMVLTAGLVRAEDIAPGGWQSDCDDQFCVFRKTLTLQTTKFTFALLEILIDVETGESTIVLTAPLGLALQPGIKLIVSEQEWIVPLKVCYADGCRGTVDISSEEFALLLQRPMIEIRYIPFGSEAPRSAELPLNGLISAISQASR